MFFGFCSQQSVSIFFSDGNFIFIHFFFLFSHFSALLYFYISSCYVIFVKHPIIMRKHEVNIEFISSRNIFKLEFLKACFVLLSQKKYEKSFIHYEKITKWKKIEASFRFKELVRNVCFCLSLKKKLKMIVYDVHHTHTTYDEKEEKKNQKKTIELSQLTE